MNLNLCMNLCMSFRCCGNVVNGAHLCCNPCLWGMCMLCRTVAGTLGASPKFCCNSFVWQRMVLWCHSYWTFQLLPWSSPRLR